MEIPRSTDYQHKEIATQGFIKLNGMRYYRRIFCDQSAELVRFDDGMKRWVFLLFVGD